MRGHKAVPFGVALAGGVSVMAGCGWLPAPVAPPATSSTPAAEALDQHDETASRRKVTSRRRALSPEALATLRKRLATYRTASASAIELVTDGSWILEAPLLNNWVVQDAHLGAQLPGAQWLLATTPKDPVAGRFDAYATSGFVIPAGDPAPQLRLTARYAAPHLDVVVYGLDGEGAGYYDERVFDGEGPEPHLLDNVVIPTPPQGTYEFDLEAFEAFDDPGVGSRTTPAGFIGKLVIGAADGGPAPSPLTVEHAAFSPDRPGGNPDDNKDTNRIDVAVAAGEPWTLVLDGKGTLTSGVGPGSLTWDGRFPMGGTNVIGDGTYGLRLVRPGMPDAFTNITLDTVRPRVREVAVTGIEQTALGTDIQYTFGLQADDEGGSAHAGVRPGSARLAACNVTIKAQAEAAATPGGGYRLQASLAPEAQPRLTFGVVVEDEAGNVSATKNGHLAINLDALGMEVREKADCQVSSSSPYKIQGVSDELATIVLDEAAKHCLEPVGVDAKNLEVYYNTSGIDYKYYLGIGIRPPGSSAPIKVPSPFRLPVVVRFVKEADGVTWATFPTTINGFTPVFTSSVRWNGRFMDLPIGGLAPQGKFKVEVSYGGGQLAIPGVDFASANKKKALRGFKVSNQPVLRYEEWRDVVPPTDLTLDPQQVPAHQPNYVYSKICHILDRHVLSDFNVERYQISYRSIPREYQLIPNKTRYDGVPEDLFSNWDPDQTVSRPPTFTEANDFGNFPPFNAARYFQTIDILHNQDNPIHDAANEVLARLNKIATAILRQPPNVAVDIGDHDDGLAMPVVFPRGRIVWTGELPANPIDHPGRFNSIFPAWKDKTRHERSIAN